MIKSEKTFYDYFDVYLSSESGSAYWNTIFAPSYIEETVNGETRRIATFKEYTFSGALKKLNYKGKNIEYEWKYSWWLIGKNFGGVDCAVKKKIEGDGILETQYEYSPFWDVTSITLPNGYKTIYEYDKFRRLTGIFEKQPNTEDPVALQKFMYHYHYNIKKY